MRTIIILAGLMILLTAGFSMAGDTGKLSAEWIGAPCLSDADCGEYKCCNGACDSACRDHPVTLAEWIGAPCLSDADCGEYKCCNNACAESCRDGKLCTPEASLSPR